MNPHLTVTLRCAQCDRQRTFRPWFSLTKRSVLRLEGGAYGFYVDGGTVLCPECAGDKRDLPAQRETWTEYDRSSVEGDQAHEAHLDRIVAANPGLKRTD